MCVSRQLNPSQARILVLMADGSLWPMVHVGAGSLVGGTRERVLSYASSVGKEARVLLRAQVPNYITVGVQDESLATDYEILEADTLVRNTLGYIEDALNKHVFIERYTIRISDFGESLCAIALPGGGD